MHNGLFSVAIASWTVVSRRLSEFVGGIAVKETVISARSWDCNYGAEHSTRLDVQITSE
jgi:hypothetical protein